MLTIWAQGDSQFSRSKTATLEKVFAPIFRAYRPNVPQHRFIEFKDEQDLPEPQAGEVILVCGNRVLDVLRKAGVVHKTRTLGGLRETPIARGAGHFMVTYDPFNVLNEPEKHQVVEWDIRLAHRFQTTGQLKPVVGDYKWVGSYQPMIDEIEAEFAKTGKPVKVAFDSETMGLYPWYKHKDFVCISFTHRAGTAQLLYMGPKKHPVAIQPGVIEQIRRLLTSPKVRLRMANGKYDLIWVKEKWGLDCTNFTIDTLLVGSLLDENRTNSLNLHAKIFTDLGGYDDAFNNKYDKAHMERAELDELLIYQGGDTDACYRAADVLQAELALDPELKRFYQVVLHPAARAFEKVERRGVLVDPEKFAVLRDDLKKVIAETQKRQLDLLPNRLKTKFRERIDERLAGGANPLLPSILQEFFFGETGLRLKPLQRTPTGKISLTKPHLRAVAEGRPEAAAFLAAMTEMDSAMKTLSTFVEGFLKHLRPDMRFHPSYMLFHGGFGDDGDDESGTVTGRLSAKEPAFQTIPKKTKWAKRLRECYIAAKGKVMVSIDYSQGELRVVACVAPEKTMIQAYLDGLDLHAVTGAKLAQVPLDVFLTWKENEDKELAEKFDDNRGKAKPANFGLLYGMSAEGFQAYAWTAYGVKLTAQEAEQMRAAFFELYPGLPAYHEKMRTFVGLNKHVRSPLGRVRHLPAIDAPDRTTRSTAQRQAINSPIQSCLADMMEWAIALIDEEVGDDFEAVGNVHDALVGYIDEDKVATVLPQVTHIMSNLPLHKLGWKPQLQFIVDAEVGPNMAALKKWKTVT